MLDKTYAIKDSHDSVILSDIQFTTTAAMINSTLFKKVILILIMLGCLITLAYSQQLAFPGAEGFGRYTVGGRGGTVYHVTNLNDSGPGSFRDAVSQPYRTVVFDVGGVIHISSRIVIKHHVTVAGQTAPGGGITIYGNGIAMNGDSGNDIVRYIRIRMGRNGDSGKDALAISEKQDYIFDNVSISWGRDGTLDVNGSGIDNLTFQDCIIGQGINNSNHSTGGLMQSGKWSMIRSLYIDNKTRNPKARGTHEFINSVLYNWGSNGYIMGDTEGLSECNLIGNHFIYGPSSSDNSHITRTTPQFHVYPEDNWVDSARDGSLNPYLLTDYKTATVETEPYNYPGVINLMSAQDALNYVIQNVGASRYRDQVDEYMINELLSYGTEGAIINTEDDNGISGNVGYVPNGPAPADTDQDGMPDFWELDNGFDPNVADNNLDADGDGYTNLEEYLDWIIYNVPDIYISAYSIIEAENYSAQSGVQTESSSEGGSNVAYIENGDWISFEEVEFGEEGADQFLARVAGGGGAISVRLDSLTGPEIGNLPVYNTGGWQNWVTEATDITQTTGRHDIYLVFEGGSGFLFNLNYLQFGVKDNSTDLTLQEKAVGFCGVEGSVDNNNPGFTGYGFANTDNAVGTGIDWKIAIPAGGEKEISFRYATSTDRPGDLIIDGSTVLSDINFPSTGDFVTWDTVTVSLYLDAGIKDVRLEATGSSGLGNIDYIRITDAQAASCAAPQYTLAVNVVGDGNVSPAGGAFNQGQSISLTASGNIGYEFGSWTGDVTGTDNPIGLVMDANKSVTANFNQLQATLTKQGAGSSNQNVDQHSPITAFSYAWEHAHTVSVTGMPAGIDVDIDNANQTVSISGTPTEGGTYNFTVETVDGGIKASKNGTFQINYTEEANLIHQGEGEATQLVVKDSLIQEFSFLWENANTVTVSGLPAGITTSIDDVARVVTFSGTPLQAGIFDYVITTQGGITDATANGSFVVVGLNAPVLTKCGGGSSIQTVNVNTPIEGFCYTWDNAVSVSVSGLPEGVDAEIDNLAKRVDISGVPSELGTFNFTVTTVGGLPEEASLSGSITVEDVDITPPSTPENLAASNVSTNSFDLSWSPSTDNVGVTSYDVFLDGSLYANVTDTALSFTGLNDATSYSVNVAANDAEGNTSDLSAALEVNTLDGTAPEAPSNLEVTLITSSRVDLSWDEATDNVGVTSYNIYLDGSLYTNVVSTSGSVTGLGDATSYSFAVTALDAAGHESQLSNTESATTLDATPPSVPENLISSNITTNSMDLSWDASGDNVGVTNYHVYVNGNYYASSGITSMNITGLSDATTYSLQVSALDEAGNESDLSTAITTTTDELINNDVAASAYIYASSEKGHRHATKANDGNTNSYWESNNGMPQWLEVDLGATQEINTVAIMWGVSYGITYAVEYSTDSINWTTAQYVNNGNGGYDEHTMSFEARFVRVFVSSVYDGHFAEIRELEVYVYENGSSSSREVHNAPSLELPEPHVSIYPNPTYGVLNIEFTDEYLGSDMVIYSAAGRQVRTYNNLMENNLRIPQGSLEAGVYLLRITNGNHTRSMKVIVR